MELEKYVISIEKNGRMVPVGSIDGGDYRTAQFSYMDEYLDEANAVPVSISLPLQRERFSAGQTRQFFEGLLPEDMILSVQLFTKAAQGRCLFILAMLF